MRILIAVLSAACLLVACLIIVVLRRPAPRKKRYSRADKEEANTLARIDAVRPAPPKLAPVAPEALPPLPVSDPLSYGRMPSMPGAPESTQRADRRAGPLPAARIPEGPLPFERVSPQTGWGNSPDLPMWVAPNGGMPNAAPPASNPGLIPAAYGDGNGNGNLGSTPGVAAADPMPALGQGVVVLGRPADAPEPRRVGALTRVYAEGMQVQYDPTYDAIDIVFADCPMRSPAEAELAFRVLLAKVRTVLKPLGRDRAALLMDVAGLERGVSGQPVWNESLKAFLPAACEQVGPGRLLIARYDSRAAGGSQQARLASIQSAAPAMAWSLQRTIFGSRVEAAELLARLREPAAISVTGTALGAPIAPESPGCLPGVGQGD